MKILGPLHGMHGSTEAELKVQRTIKRAELTAFLCLLRRVIGPIKVHGDNKRNYRWAVERRKEMHRSTSGDADLWIKIWEELHFLVSKEILAGVEHFKAHRTKKDKKYMSHFEKFVTEGIEKADEFAKAGAMLDEGFMAEARAKTVQQDRRSVRSLAACSQLSLFSGRMEGLC